MTHPYDGSSDRHREAARPLHGRAQAHPANPPRADRQGRRGDRTRADRCCLYRRRGHRVPQRGKCPAASDRFRRPAERGRGTDSGARARGRALRLQLDGLHRRGRRPDIRGEVRRQGRRTTSSRTPTDVRQARRGRRRLRRQLPDLGRHPGDFIARGARRALDQSLIPNIANLGAEWANPATTQATPTRSRTCGGRRASATTRRDQAR